MMGQCVITYRCFHVQVGVGPSTLGGASGHPPPKTHPLPHGLTSMHTPTGCRAGLRWAEARPLVFSQSLPYHPAQRIIVIMHSLLKSLLLCVAAFWSVARADCMPGTSGTLCRRHACPGYLCRPVFLCVHPSIPPLLHIQIHKPPQASPARPRRTRRPCSVAAAAKVGSRWAGAPCP